MEKDKKLLYQRAKMVLQEYLIQTTKAVKERAERGFGKRVIGKVKNRPEDEKISIDEVGEIILEKLLKKYNLPASVFTEHKNIIHKSPEIFGALDPFDGSKLFKKGFEHLWYTALSFYDKNSQPIACGIADILNEKLYLTSSKENYLVPLKNGKKIRIFPSRKKRADENLTLASYVMSSEYSPKLIEFFGDFIKNMSPKAMLYPNGGNCIYAYLASGKVDAYIMFNEPRSEIDAGYPIAKFAGCQIVSVNPDGTYENYEFIPGRQHQKVKLLIAACTPQLRDELIKHYLKNK
jgi:fructose-1,6-bisphosphatase/inositol monophosphatase family enzyme